MLIHLIKPFKRTTISYQTRLLHHDATSVVVRALWTRPAVDLGYIQIAPGDQLDEYFYTDDWYNIFAWYSAAGALRGWYCNVALPATRTATSVTSVDLELDLFVSPDRSQLTRLDVDEYEARGYAVNDPHVYQQGYHALAALEALAQSGSGPFAVTELR
ncbi:MAG: hypothetical protein RLZZ297_1186 [Chloroflexota bacterium]|jgi:predicted RNA-binding protein associated with RNAse of E/G family